jgi:phenylalanyl-tRNA synthetase alpha chain
MIKDLQSTDIYGLKNEAGLAEEEFRIGLSWLMKKGWISIKKGEGIITLTEGGRGALLEKGDDERLIELLAARREINLEDLPSNLRATYDDLRRRNLIIERERKEISLELTDLGVKALKGEVEVIEEISRLTSAHIIKGAWKKVRLKEYDVKASPPIIYPGRKHPYLEFLDEARRILLNMGFVEVKGPFVESQFWNFDALFQAQDHPAREIHSSFILKNPTVSKLEPNEYVKRVKAVHENGGNTGSRGWGYEWSFDLARKLILRSQCTSVSMRTLFRKKRAPLKAFTIDKVFRPDVLDKTHSMEFHQCEGIVLGEGLNFRHLLGYLKRFAWELGFKKVKFLPAYFPFTEPSAECFVHHHKLGWVEVLGAVLFRSDRRCSCPLE